MSGTAFKGVSSSADTRFTDKEKKLLKSMKFPKEYEQKVDLKKVKWEVMKAWIATRVTELLGVEDEVLVGYIYEQIEGKSTLDPRILQINLTGFLEKNTSLFVKELWTLLASAAETDSGIPQKLLDDKAEELRKKKEMQDKINERLAKDREKRDRERREAVRKEEAEREERRRQREREREAERERDRKRREQEREQREKDRLEREKRREAERQREREIDAERQKAREARRAEERRRDREREKERDLEREQARQRREERSQAEEKSNKQALPVAMDTSPRRDSAENGHKRLRQEEGPDVAEEVLEAKKLKKEKKEKREKKEKKEKKAKKEKKEKKDKREKKHDRQSGSGGESDDDSAGDFDRKRSLEDDLRQKALLSVRKD